jgi:probable phosphoglycerate mutase
MGLRPEARPWLIEMDWGRLEGRGLAEIRAEGGLGFAANEALGLDFRPDGGETPREVGARALGGLTALGEDTVCITHKGVLRALFARALDWDMRGKAPVKLGDGCCHRFVLEAGGVLRLVVPNIPLDPSARTTGLP